MITSQKYKHVLFISYDGLTDPLGQAQILPYLVGLSGLGHEITVLSCEKLMNHKKNKNIVEEKCRQAGIKWEYVFYENKIPVVSPYMNSTRLRKRAEEVFQVTTFDIVHCRSIIPAGIGYSLCKNSQAKLIFDIRGFWADERVDGKIWNRKNPVFNFLYHHFKKKEKFLFAEADCIVTLTENARTYITENYKTKNNFQVVPCCVDFNHFDLESIKEDQVELLKDKLGIKKDQYVLTYVGSLGARYMLREMLTFFKVVKEKKKDSVFLFITKSETSEIKSICSEIGLDHNAVIITSCEYSQIPLYISTGDASVFFIVTSFSGKAVSPTKQAEVMSLGLPIVANTGLGDTDIILSKTGSGIVLQEFTESAYEKAAEALLEFRKNKNEIRQASLEFFTLESGVQKYNEVYSYL